MGEMTKTTTEVLVALDEVLWSEAQAGIPAFLRIAARPAKSIGRRLPAHDNPALWLPGRGGIGRRLKGEYPVVGIARMAIKGAEDSPKNFAVVEQPLPEGVRQVGEPMRYGVLIGHTAVNDLAAQVGMPPVYWEEFQESLANVRVATLSETA